MIRVQLMRINGGCFCFLYTSLANEHLEDSRPGFLLHLRMPTHQMLICIDYVVTVQLITPGVQG
jgi:hypothetical protein